MVIPHKLCNLCLKPNEMDNDCRVKRCCTAEGCGRPHHRLLHTKIEIRSQRNNDKTAVEKVVMTTSCNLQTSHVFLSVIPVVIRNGDNRVYAYAFLDSGASCFLITDKLRRALELTGRTVSLSLKTLLDKVVSDTTEVGINLESLDGHVKIDLKAWTVERLPNSRHKIPATSTLTK